MSVPGGPSAVRRLGVYGITVVLAVTGLASTSFAASSFGQRDVPLHLPWWALLPAYLLALQRPLEYELRRETRMLTLTQIPMTVALVCVAPWWHLLARTSAAVLDVALRRQPPIKVTYNIALGATEVGLAAAVLSATTTTFDPNPRLWLALLVSMLVSEAVTWIAIQGVLALMVAPSSPAVLVRELAGNGATSATFTSLGVVAVAAAWTDVWTLAVIALLAIGLALGYRRHRRLSTEAQQQAEMQRFLKGLGPLDLTDDLSSAALEQVRALLHTERLSLILRLQDEWVEFETAEGQSISRSPCDAPAGTTATIQADNLSSPLLHDGELIGVLRASERMGMRHFSLRDIRLIEIVAAELAKAIDRGTLQRKLALAATTDPLTHLPNLNETSRLIDDYLSANGATLILAAVAVDSFREVNDTLGHEVGDELLLEVTRRLRLGYADALIGRIGGGRFAIAMDADRVGNDPAMFGLGLRAQVEGGAQLGPVGTHIRLSVGCVSAPEHGDDAAHPDPARRDRHVRRPQRTRGPGGLGARVRDRRTAPAGSRHGTARGPLVRGHRGCLPAEALGRC